MIVGSDTLSKRNYCKLAFGIGGKVAGEGKHSVVLLVGLKSFRDLYSGLLTFQPLCLHWEGIVRSSVSWFSSLKSIRF